MNPISTISCACGCMFQVAFQDSTLATPPQCPQCNTLMSEKSWAALREAMSCLSDFNHHILKWHLEYDEPRMLVPAITVSTLTDQDA